MTIARLPMRGTRIIVASLDTNHLNVRFSKTDWPLSSSSSWVQTITAAVTNRPPALAGKTTGTSELWIAAIANLAQNNNTLPGMTVLVSTDGFSSASFITLAPTTVHSPSLTFDSFSGRFVLAFVMRDQTVAQDDKIFAMTSFDGFTWTAPQDLGQWTYDGPDVECTSNSNCMITYSDAAVGGGLKPILTSRRFTVDPFTGFVTMWNHSTSNFWTFPTPSVGVRRQFGYWETSLLWSNDLDHYARGEGYLYTAFSTTNPPGSYPWEYVDFAKSRPDFASPLGNDNAMYMFYVK